MDYEIVWTMPAADDLEGIWRYVAADSPSAADNLVAELVHCVEQIRTFPSAAAIFRKSRHPIRAVTHRNYRIFYRVREQSARVQILCIRHSARRDPRFPRE